jgi:hypothetical protein
MDNSGSGLVVWERSDGINERVQASIRSPGASGTFGTISTLSAAGQNGFEPKAGAGPNVDANGVAVWTRSDGTNLRVQSSRRRDVTGFPRPKGASPFKTSLVPAFNQCVTGNRVHGAPLANASCAPPVQSSSILTIGSPDANGAGANFAGTAQLIQQTGNVRLLLSMSDVRNKTTLTDYTGSVRTSMSVQITDNLNATETPEPGTVQSFTYTFDAPCTATGSTTIGSTCAVDTTANALVPGTIGNGFRAIWQLGQIQVKDPGPDATLGNGDDGTFARQGVFVP